MLLQSLTLKEMAYPAVQVQKALCISPDSFFAHIHTMFGTSFIFIEGVHSAFKKQ